MQLFTAASLEEESDAVKTDLAELPLTNMDEGGTSGSQRRVDLLEELRLGLAGVGSSQASSSAAGSSQAAREAGSADPSAALAAQLQEEEDAKARGAKRVAAKLARARDAASLKLAHRLKLEEGGEEGLMRQREEEADAALARQLAAEQEAGGADVQVEADAALARRMSGDGSDRHQQEADADLARRLAAGEETDADLARRLAAEEQDAARILQEEADAALALRLSRSEVGGGGDDDDSGDEDDDSTWQDAAAEKARQEREDAALARRLQAQDDDVHGRLMARGAASLRNSYPGIL